MLAFGWSMVTLFTLIAFVTAALFTIQSRELAGDYYDQNYGNNQNAYQNGSSADVSVTSRALAFTALWMAILALILAFVGTVILGITSPTGKYYWCFPGAVHRTTPLSLGTFIGSLFMFANITLVAAVLFGEFKVSNLTCGCCRGQQKMKKMIPPVYSNVSFIRFFSRRYEIQRTATVRVTRKEKARKRSR
jgi:hypothetical protein